MKSASLRAPCRPCPIRSARVAPITERYLGDWQLTRTIVDRQTGETIACTGRAQLERRDDAIRYDEAVSFRLNLRAVHATRTYFYRSRSGAIDATFADGRPFFSVTLARDGTATATHQCGADLYTGSLTLRESRSWETTWTISGSKMLLIETRYTRVASLTDA